jgi:hypothetical protein
MTLGDECADRPQDSTNVGTRFLTDDTNHGVSGNLLIEYLAPVEAASGEILDVDRRGPGARARYEEWTVLAFDEDWIEVARDVLTAPQGPDPSQRHCDQGFGPGDGAALPWTVESRTRRFDIRYILLAYTGTVPADEVGLAFDNFTPSLNTCTGVWERIGNPCNGNAALGGSGCVYPGETVHLEITGGPAGACGCLAIGRVPFSNPGHPCILLQKPFSFLFPHMLDASGRFSVEVRVPRTASVAGQEFLLQAAHLTPGGGISFTNGLRVSGAH